MSGVSTLELLNLVHLFLITADGFYMAAGEAPLVEKPKKE
jgi:hypothetical protein